MCDVSVATIRGTAYPHTYKRSRAAQRFLNRYIKKEHDNSGDYSYNTGSNSNATTRISNHSSTESNTNTSPHIYTSSHTSGHHKKNSNVYCNNNTYSMSSSSTPHTHTRTYTTDVLAASIHTHDRRVDIDDDHAVDNVDVYGNVNVTMMQEEQAEEQEEDSETSASPSQIHRIRGGNWRRIRSTMVVPAMSASGDQQTVRQRHKREYRIFSSRSSSVCVNE